MKITRTRVIGGAGVVIAAIVGAVITLTGPSTVNVPAGGNVQGAINTAGCGDTIVLEARKAYIGNLTLPMKTCTDGSYITIQSSRAAELPEGKRVSPAQAELFAYLQSNVNAEPVIKTAVGAHHYRFIGIQFSTTTPDVIIHDVIRLGEGKQLQKTLDSVPHHIALDRIYIAGYPTQDVQAGVTMNCAECSVTNSYIDEIHVVGIEAQAVRSWNGPGPFHVINNTMIAAGENYMFGGADSASLELMPHNLELKRNYLFKPLSWNPNHPTFVPIMRMENGVPVAKHWTVKNSGEAKAVIGATIEGNVYENNWVDAQDGSGVLFTVRNQDCTAPHSTVQNVNFNYNTVKGIAGAALNLLGLDNESTPEYLAAHPDKCGNLSASEIKLGSVRGTGFTARNNLFIDIAGAFIQLSGFNNTTIDHSTSLQRGNLMTLYGEQSTGYKYTNNLTIDHDFGIFGDGGTGGVAALNKFTPSAEVTGNVIANAYDGGANYPPNNQYPKALTLPPDLRSPFVGVGCDVDQLAAAQSGAGITPSPSPTVTISPSPFPSPSPTVSPVVGFPSGSAVEVVSRVNVRDIPSSTGSTVKFIAEVGDRGVTIGDCQQDTVSTNVYCPATFTQGSGFVATQFVKLVGLASPTPTPTVSPSPSPPPSPSPSPSPSPANPCGNPVAYPPTSKAGRNTVLADKWAIRCRLKREIVGKNQAEFERVP